MRAALFCIFTYLDTRTLLHAAEVCRDWRFVARHPAVWTRVLLENARVCSKVPVFARRPCCEPTFLPHRTGALEVWPLHPFQHPSFSLAPPDALRGLPVLGLVSLQPNQAQVPPSPGNPFLPAVPGHAGSVVHPGPLPDAAELEAPAAGQEGEQGRVCSKHPVRPGRVGVGGGTAGTPGAPQGRLPGAGSGPKQCPEFLAIHRGCLEAGLESLLKAAGGNLLILRISHCPNILTDRSLWLASCYCRALQAVTYRYFTTSPLGAKGVPAVCIPFPQGSKARGPKSSLVQGKGAAATRVGGPSSVFSTGVPQTPWAMRSFGPWAQVAERLSPSRWRHFTLGEPQQGFGGAGG